MIEISQNCLLVLDDSCEEICQQSEFCDLAVAGRHQKFSGSLIEQLLFHQRDQYQILCFQTTHTKLFKSPLALQQIDKFSKEFKETKLSLDFNKRSKFKMYVVFLIGFDSNTCEFLLYSWNNAGLKPSIFLCAFITKKQTLLTNEKQIFGNTEATAQKKEMTGC